MKTPVPFKRALMSVAVIAATGLALTMPGCGGSDSSGPVTYTYTGTATAPNSLLVANPGLFERIEGFFINRAVAGVSGSSPLNGATVELVKVDDNGDQVSVVATTTTAADGTFTINSSVAPDANYIIRVTSGAVVLRSPLYATSVDVNPASEAVLQQLIASAEPLDNFSVSELQAIVDYVEAENVSFDSITSVDEALATAQAALPLLDDLVDDFSAADAPAALAGTFHFAELGYSVNVDADNTTQDQNGFESNFAEMRVSASHGTATVSGNSMSMTGTEMYAAANLMFSLQNNVLQMLGVTTSTGSEATGGAGTFTAGTNGSLMLATESSVFAGQTDTSRQVFVLATVEDEDNSPDDTSWRGLALGVKRSSSTPAVSGTYYVANMELGADSGAANTASLRAGGQLFALTFSGGNVTGTSETDAIELTINGADDTLSTDVASDVLSGVTYSITTGGAVIVNTPGDTLDGAASPDGQMMFLRGNYGTSQELVLGVKQGSGMAQTALAGTWRMVGLGVGLGDGTGGAINGNARASSAMYDVTFYCDGSMKGVTGNNRQADVRFDLGNVWRGLQAEAANGQVLTVAWNGANDGRFMLDDPSTDVLEGAMSASGDFYVLSVRGSETGQAWRELFLGIRKSSTCEPLPPPP